MYLRIAAGGALAMASSAMAGEVPLYQPAPGWIAPAPPVPDATPGDGGSALAVLDLQQRIEGGRVWAYRDIAMRATTAEALAEMGTITTPWIPDKGDLIVHGVEIIRGAAHIDLLKAGARFTVLRREQGLERNALDGVLTATMAAQGLQLGDVLRVRISVTQADAALKGRAQAILPVPADPVRIGFGRVRLSWPAADDIHWKLYADGTPPPVKLVDGYRELTLALPLAKQPDLPDDAPARFARPPILEAGSFADWADVSRTVAPLFAVPAIDPAGPLGKQVATIAAATADPADRAARALQLVQDQVRYLALGMNGGNYVPQAPADTWTLRYGDCKAKTLLLLAMLKPLGVEAEAVLASSDAGDLLSRRLPIPGAFDHVLVRATVGGRTLWLDGTRSGARLADLADTPPLRYVLPLRADGAALMPVALHADARPEVSVETEIDQTAGLDLPTPFRTVLTVRGQGAAMLNAAALQGTAEQKRNLFGQWVQRFVGEAQMAPPVFRFDPVAGTAHVTARGIVASGWYVRDRRLTRPFGAALGTIDFDPNRARVAWRDIPVQTGGPASLAQRTRIRLPGDGRGFALDGEGHLAATLAGVALRRDATLDGGIATIDERADALGMEIAAAGIPAERARLAQAKARPLRLLAPPDVRRRWQGPVAPGGYKAAEAAYAEAIAADPDDITGYQSRAAFRTGTYDRRGAIADWTRVLAIGPTADFHLNRAALFAALGDLKAAVADTEAARALDPASTNAVLRLADLRSEQGDAKGALALLQERVDAGGEDRSDFLRAKADAQADAGDVAGALATLDAAIGEKPGNPDLLNARCWIKGTHAQALDTALKDCTKAIELSDNPAGALDSRGLVYFRMGRMDDARADLDAALDASPGSGGSLYLRSLVRRRGGDATGADADLAAARIIYPRVEQRYARWSIKP